MPPVRLVIADDHPLVRSGLCAVLLAAEDLEVVGEAATGEEVVTLAASLQPDVIVMDLRMPGLNGIEATRRILQTQPHIRIVVLTLFEDDDSLFAALRAGARGYILKDANEVEVVRAIRAASSGEAIFSATMAQHLIASFASPRQPGTAFPFPDLPAREREILALIAQERSNTEIAQRLVISGKTVRNYISSISANCRSPTGPRRSSARERRASASRRQIGRAGGCFLPKCCGTFQRRGDEQARRFTRRSPDHSPKHA